MKKLSQLLTSVSPLQVVGDTGVDITDVINDSRQARQGAQRRPYHKVYLMRHLVAIRQVFCPGAGCW